MSIFDFLKKKDEEDEIVQNDEQALETAVMPETSQPKIQEPVSFEQKLLTELDQIKKQSDDEIKSARTRDKWMSLAQTLNQALATKDQAKALKVIKQPGMQAFGTDLKLDTNTASKLMDERKNRISELLNEYKLTSQLRGKQMTPEERRKFDADIKLKEAQTAKYTKEATETDEDKELRSLKVQQLKQELSKKPGDDLTPEQQESAKLDLALKRADLEQAQKKLIEDPDKTFMEKQKGLLEIQKMLSDIKKTDAQVDQMSAPKQLSELDLANIEKAKAQAKMYESKVNPATNPLLEKKMQTEELRQQDLKRKQAESKAQIQGNLDKIDEQINDLLKADAGLKKGGVTGLVDNTLGKWWDMARGNEDQMTRQLLNKIETQITLMGSGSLKGAISDKEIDLLKQEVPSKFGDEKNWRSWIKPRIELLQKARKNVASQLSEGMPEESSNKSPIKQVVKKQYSVSKNKTKIIYADGTEEIVDGQQ